MDKLTEVVDNLLVPRKRDSTTVLLPDNPRVAPTTTNEAISGESSGSPRETFFRYFPVSERDRKWGIYATMVGTSRIGAHVRYRPVAHPESYHYRWPQTRVLPEFAISYISAGGGMV